MKNKGNIFDSDSVKLFKEEIKPKNWLLKFNKTSLSYLILYFMFYNALGLVFNELTNIIFSLFIPNYQKSFEMGYPAPLVVTAGPIEDIIAFGIPLYITGNSFLMIPSGIIWTFMH